MAKDNKLQKQGSSELTAPSFMQEDKGQRTGAEHFTKDDILMPRIGIAQGLSPQLDEDKAQFIPGLKNFEMFNSVTGEIYGKGPIFFYVIHAGKPRGVQFKPRDEGGGVLDPNVALYDERMKFGDKGEKPIATKFYDYIVVFENLETIIALSMKSTMLKVARQLNALIQFRDMPIYAGRYELKVVKETNSQGTWGLFSISNAGWPPTEESYNTLKELYERFKEEKVDIDWEGREAEAEDTVKPAAEPVQGNVPF